MNVLVSYSCCSPQRAFTFLSWYPSRGRYVEHRHPINKEQDTTLCPLPIALKVTWAESKPSKGAVHQCLILASEMIQTSPLFSWILFSCQNFHWPSYLAALSISFWTFKCGYLKEAPTCLCSWVKENHRINETGRGCFLHLVQGHVQNRHLKSGCSKPFEHGTLHGILTMSVISQHVSDFSISLGTQCSEQSNTHAGTVRCAKDSGHI